MQFDEPDGLQASLAQERQTDWPMPEYFPGQQGWHSSGPALMTSIITTCGADPIVTTKLSLAQVQFPGDPGSEHEAQGRKPAAEYVPASHAMQVPCGLKFIPAAAAQLPGSSGT